MRPRSSRRVPSPFPGMDPYLEDPALWPNVHQRLITYGSDLLQEQVGERYFVGIGERLYLEGPERGVYPDLAVAEVAVPRPSEAPGSRLAADAPTVVVLEPVERREVFLELRDLTRGERVVTVVEVLSPANKRPGPGRDLYLQEQGELLGSSAHLVEIDLLRAGEPTAAVPAGLRAASPYLVVVSRAEDRGRRELYGFGLRERPPRVGVPLAAPDPDAVLDLPALVRAVYERGAFGRRLDYGRDPTPPLPPGDTAWARTLLSGR